MKSKKHLISKTHPGNYARRIKIVTVGDSAVGKSSLIKRFCERRFDKRSTATVALDYGSIQANVRGCRVFVDFWDLSGKPEYLVVRNECYVPIPSSVLLIFDVNKRASFESLDNWMKELKRQEIGLRSRSSDNVDSVAIILCGNKIDCIQRSVKRSEAVAFKEKHKLLAYFEVSAREGSNVDAMFENLFESSTI